MVVVVVALVVEGSNGTVVVLDVATDGDEQAASKRATAIVGLSIPIIIGKRGRLPSQL